MSEIIVGNVATIEELTISINHIANNSEGARETIEKTSQLSSESAAAVSGLPRKPAVYRVR